MTSEPRDYVLPVDKPVGPTSHDIVQQARRALATRQVGHTGTLDPFASGLLLLCINGATRIADLLTGLDKSYRATARFDGATDTDDATGEFILRTTQQPTREELDAVIATLVGTAPQRPPRYSARKKEGVRAYQAARRGQDLRLDPVTVTIHRIEVTRFQPPEVDLEVDCSSGTYIRAIARDLGERLGTGGYLTALRRTRIGRFSVQEAVPPDRLGEGNRIAIEDALSHLPRVDVAPQVAQRLRFGQRIAGEFPAADPLVIVCEGQAIALGKSEGHVLRPVKVWAHD